MNGKSFLVMLETSLMLKLIPVMLVLLAVMNVLMTILLVTSVMFVLKQDTLSILTLMVVNV